MQLQIIEDIDSLQSYAGEWKELLGENNPNPYITLDWILCWWKFYGVDKQLHVLRFFDEKGTVGFFPLMKIKKRFHTEYRFIGYPQVGRIDLIVRPDMAEAFIREVIAYLKGIQGGAVFYLHGLNREAPWRETLSRELAGVPSFTKTLPSYLIRLKETNLEEYFQHVRRHYTIKRTFSLERALAKTVPLTLTQATPEEIPQIFPLHEKRWSKKNDENGFGRGISKEFFTNLAQHKISPDWDAQVFLLKAGEILIGFTYVIVCHGRLITYRLAHDDDFSLYKPGMIALMKTFEESFAREVEIVDFSTGAEPYKEFWADGYETVDQVIFTTRHWASRLALAKTSMLYKLRQSLKKNAMLARFKRVTVGRIKYTLSGAGVRKFIQRLPRMLRLLGFSSLISPAFAASKSGVRLYTMSHHVNRIPEEAPFSLRMIPLEELGTLTDLLMMNPQSIVKRYYHGERCGIVLREDLPVATVWVSHHEYKKQDKVLWKSHNENDVCYHELIIFKKWKAYAEEILLCLVHAPRKRRAQVYILIGRSRKMMRIAERIFAETHHQKAGASHETVHS